MSCLCVFMYLLDCTQPPNPALPCYLIPVPGSHSILLILAPGPPKMCLCVCGSAGWSRQVKLVARTLCLFLARLSAGGRRLVSVVLGFYSKSATVGVKSLHHASRVLFLSSLFSCPLHSIE